MKTAALFFCRCSAALVAFPVFAAATGDMIPLKNGRQISVAEFRADNQECAREAAAKHPSIAIEESLSSEQRRKDATRKFAQALGTDMSSENELLTSLGNRLRQQIEIAQEARNRINEKQRISLLDSPSGWLHGQLTIEEDVRTLNQATREADETLRLISMLTGATEAVNRAGANLERGIPYPSSQKPDSADGMVNSSSNRSIISGQRGQHHYRCMLALGYAGVRVQEAGTGEANGFSEYADRSATSECRVNADCRSGKSCRSKSGGGTECR